LLLDAFPASALAAVALRAAGRGAAAAASGELADFLRLLDLFAVARRAFVADFLADFLADVLIDVLVGVLADVTDSPRVAFPEDALAVFLRVFLDIRLPFVAFSGSIIRPLRVVPGKLESSGPLGKSDGLGVGLQGFDAPLVRSLNVPWAG
jgi:hypothetical protein